MICLGACATRRSGLKMMAPIPVLSASSKNVENAAGGEILECVEAGDEHLSPFAPYIDVGRFDDHGGGDFTCKAVSARDHGSALERGELQRVGYVHVASLLCSRLPVGRWPFHSVSVPPPMDGSAKGPGAHMAPRGCLRINKGARSRGHAMRGVVPRGLVRGACRYRRTSRLQSLL